MRVCDFLVLQPAAVLLSLLGLSGVVLGVTGCSTEAPQGAAPASQSAEVRKSETQADAPASVPTTASTGNDSPSSTPVGTAENSKEERSGRVGPDPLTKQENEVAEGTPEASGSEVHSLPVAGSSAATAATQRKAFHPPSADQIARWGNVQRTPFRLLACRDGFGDPLVQCIALSPDGSRFAVGGAKLTLWNTSETEPTIDLLAEVKGEEGNRPIHSAAISPDGSFLAAGDHKGMLRIWKLVEQSETTAIRAHEGRLMQLAVSPSSQRVATTSYDGEVRLWETATGKSVKKLKVSDRQLSALGFVTDDLLAIAGSEVSLWDIPSGERKSLLTTGPVVHSSFGLSPDRKIVAFADADSKTHFWEIDKEERSPLVLHDPAPRVIAFSADGKQLAVVDQDSTVRIFDAITGQTVQVLDATGSRTADLKWHPAGALIVASETGRVRIWGTNESATILKIEPFSLPEVAVISADSQTPASSAQLQNVIDIRSFPRFPGSIPQWSDFGIAAYQVTASQEEVEQFYRYVLPLFGWTESTEANETQPGLSFTKDHCRLSVAFQPGQVPGPEGALSVNLHFAGHFDVRTLPRVSAIPSPSDWNSFSFVSYRSKADMTELEVELLKKLHEQGWTPFNRLNASSLEQPDLRLYSLLNRGSTLSLMIGYSADAPDQLAVQMNVSVTPKSLPIPPDAGWIEFDSSTDLQMVATTTMNLDQSIEFYDREMAREGWLKRLTGRAKEEDRAWLPYVRGQQEVIVRLKSLSAGQTRVIVGDAERNSWQLKEQSGEASTSAQTLFEAADIPVPKEATNVKFDADQKQITYDLPGISPPKAADSFVEHLSKSEWKREKSGVISDEYVLVTCSKGKAEVQLRARALADKTTVMISGDGLAWAKPLPAPAVRVSYGTWLRREKRDATLKLLDEFAREMMAIPASNPTGR
ncbi:hypothetical protein [Schlesneria sp. T3-172]|uniref:hypothetical protein n=1 Tax=Schlesneria sphaerica TaxID=3373610 RepID=UPI0037CB2450